MHRAVDRVEGEIDQDDAGDDARGGGDARHEGEGALGERVGARVEDDLRRGRGDRGDDEADEIAREIAPAIDGELARLEALDRDEERDEPEEQSAGCSVHQLRG